MQSRLGNYCIKTSHIISLEYLVQAKARHVKLSQPYNAWHSADVIILYVGRAVAIYRIQNMNHNEW